MSLREAAQRALEALDHAGKTRDWILAGAAITALRAALAEPQPCNKSCAPGYCYCECPHGVTDGNCKECYCDTHCTWADHAAGCVRANPEPPLEAETEAEKIAYCAGWWDALAKARKAEPVQEPVAWMHTDAYNPKVRFLEWSENARGYRGDWIKTPLYTAPTQRAHGIG